MIYMSEDKYNSFNKYMKYSLSNLPKFDLVLEGIKKNGCYQGKFLFIDLSNLLGESDLSGGIQWGKKLEHLISLVIRKYLEENKVSIDSALKNDRKIYISFMFFTKRLKVPHIDNFIFKWENEYPEFIDQKIDLDEYFIEKIKEEKIIIDTSISYSSPYDDRDFFKDENFKKTLSFGIEKIDGLTDDRKYSNGENNRNPQFYPLKPETQKLINDFGINIEKLRVSFKNNKNKDILNNIGKKLHTIINYDDVNLLKKYIFFKNKYKDLANFTFKIISGDKYRGVGNPEAFSEVPLMFKQSEENNMYELEKFIKDNQLDKFEYRNEIFEFDENLNQKLEKNELNLNDLNELVDNCSTLPFLERTVIFNLELVSDKIDEIKLKPEFNIINSLFTTSYVHYLPLINQSDNLNQDVSFFEHYVAPERAEPKAVGRSDNVDQRKRAVQQPSPEAAPQAAPAGKYVPPGARKPGRSNNNSWRNI